MNDLKARSYNDYATKVKIAKTGSLTEEEAKKKVAKEDE
jgi:hypothetical protein